ncbi:DUF7065 domain-containing protein [Novosphingobium cyanobacteriorum]|uniref:DUF7065 domain-containing protein n=1 Tax=Novosphingobium cyanobacteriorum TaxID=3024215 RepID=A0ABT6CE68_9SPHN|nr:hypothetical protein [Novosphingobium cyanobacteriorum]MDF8332211.1 hypothetical protein [Novosphingobium cyanobacteriorum]
MTALTDQDEFPHQTPSPVPERWQENFFVVAWDKAKRTGFLIHCKRWPATGQLVSRIAACAQGKVVSRKVTQSIPEGRFIVDGLELVPVTPYKELSLKGSFSGVEGFGPLGFIAWQEGGETDVKVDLSFTSDLPPVNFAEAFDKLVQSGTANSTNGNKPAFEHTQVHYEQGGKCHGSLTIGGEQYGIQGLFVRDHTWGIRDESGMSAAGHGFWTASVSDDADLFFNATGMVLNGVTHGVGVVADRTGCYSTTDVEVDFLPAGGLEAFERTRIRIGGKQPLEVAGTTLIHLIKYLPGSGPGRFDDNAISTFDCDGISGFGVHEFAGTLAPEQRAVFEALEE